ncbi:response regulator transcription factor [Chloroflexota bacterium]
MATPRDAVWTFTGAHRYARRQVATPDAGAAHLLGFWPQNGVHYPAKVGLLPMDKVLSLWYTCVVHVSITKSCSPLLGARRTEGSPVRARPADGAAGRPSGGSLVADHGEGATQRTMDGRKILIIDDDVDLIRLLEQVFSQEGAQVYTAFDGRDGLRLFQAHRPDLVILDVMMPVMDGWQTCSRICEISDVPVIMLTVSGKEADVVQGLDMGAVDYVTKPFSVKILLARVRSLLRGTAPSVEKPVTYDDGYLQIDLTRQQVSVAGETLELTRTEYRVLACLFQNADRVLAQRQILEQVWGREYRDSVEYVHVHVYRLRQKLEPDPRQPRYLVTRRGAGYCFERQAPRPEA